MLTDGYKIEAAAGRPPRHCLTGVDTAARTATCTVCGPTAIRVRIGRGGHECMTKLRAYERSRPNRSTPEGRRARRLRDTFGLQPEEYDAMLADQGGGCAICGAEQSSDGRRLAVDHCHASGRLRGILCTRCNQGLGIFADDPDLLLRAIGYLAGTVG